MNAAFKLVVVGLCLSCVMVVGACGSEPSSSPSPTPSDLTPHKQAARYFKELGPVLKVDRALARRMSKLTKLQLVDRDDAYSVAAGIDSAILPDVERAREMLANVDPPPRFRVAHARLRRVWTIGYSFMYFISDSLRQAVYTQTVDAGFTAKGNRYVARLRTAARKYDAAIKAGARRSHIKVPKRLLLEPSF